MRIIFTTFFDRNFEHSYLILLLLVKGEAKVAMLGWEVMVAQVGCLMIESSRCKQTAEKVNKLPRGGDLTRPRIACIVSSMKRSINSFPTYKHMELAVKKPNTSSHGLPSVVPTQTHDWDSKNWKQNGDDFSYAEFD